MLNLDRKQQLVFLVLTCIILIETGFLLKDKFFSSKPSAVEVQTLSAYAEQEEEDASEMVSQPESIKVYVIGEVRKPGVVSLPPESRWEDAVNAAGGLTESADMYKINLAKKVVDGETVFVPKLGDNTVAPQSNVAPGISQDGKININTADATVLDQLPGIGQTRAERIVEYREKNGYFQKIEDLKNVSGIGDKIFENLKDMITVN